MTFGESAGLKQLRVSSSVTSVEYCAFYVCLGLTQVTIASGVKSIGPYAFHVVRVWRG
jgi:hypothetical protein